MPSPTAEEPPIHTDTAVAGAQARTPTSTDGSGVGGVRLLRATVAMLVISGVVTLIYLFSLLIPDAAGETTVQMWLSQASQWLPVTVFWLIAVRTRFRRSEIVLAAAGITSSVAAGTVSMLAVGTSGFLPSPSLADIGYLLCYVLTLAALAALVRRQSRGATRAVLFDSTLAVLGASAVLAVIVLPAFEERADGISPIDGLVATLYPLADILLIAIVVGISASPVLRMGPRWQFLVIGLVLFAAADMTYALLIQNGSYIAGTPLDAAWSAGFVCVAVWMNGVDRLHSAPPVASPLIRMLPVPALAVLAGLGVLLLATQTHVPIAALALAAAAVALAAVPVMFRQAALARLVEGQEQVVERLTALDKSKSDIIGTVSHEMRTPLTSILGFLELVLDGSTGPVSDETNNMLKVAHRNARRLENMVGNMLVMSRLESGSAARAVTPLEIDRVLARAAESLRPFADSREVQIAVVCDGPLVVEGDESQIERAFTNLMENAVKFSPSKGTVRVEVTRDTPLATRPSVVVTVADTGIGIPADEVPQLFDRFFRASNARENAVPGTGLGLAIVREIVQAHQGGISATSELGEGTTFRVTLPLTHTAGA